MRKRKGIDTYVVLWTAAVFIVTTAIIVFAALRKPPVDMADIVMQAQIKAGIERSEFDPNHPPDFTVKHAEIVLSEEDGTEKLRLVTDAIIGENSIVAVKEVAAHFRLENGDALSITAEDCTYRIEGKEAVIDGAVKGEIGAQGQRFFARRLTWSEDTAIITAHDVDMIDPQFAASGSVMRIDLTTGKIKLSDGVTMDM
jgi:lipopolysaccharide export system protein LptC